MVQRPNETWRATRLGLKRSAKKWGAVSAVGISLSLGVAQTAALAGLSTTGADPKPGDRALRQMAQANAAFVVDREIEVDSTAPIPLSIILSESLGRARHEFIIIQGMPDDFKVSAGFRTKNNWFVPTMDLHSLHIIPLAHFTGTFSLRILLVQEGKQTEEQSVTVAIRQSAAYGGGVGTTAALGGDADAPGAAPQVAAPPAKRVSDAEESTSLQRAAEFVAHADIAAARLFYETLAMRGSASAAFAMGQTFDPEFLVGRRLAGLKPDVDLARRWYKKAILLGSQDAKVRLANLDGQ